MTTLPELPDEKILTEIPDDLTEEETNVMAEIIAMNIVFKDVSKRTAKRLHEMSVRDGLPLVAERDGETVFVFPDGTVKRRHELPTPLPWDPKYTTPKTGES